MIKEAPFHFKMCKKENISFLLKQTIKLFNDRVTYGDNDDLEESELYYKNLLLEHGAYLLINIETGHVCAAGVLDNGYQKHSPPWTKIDTIAVRKYRNGYGSLLMKHMVEAAEGQVIFVYAMTDRNVITLDPTRDDEEQEEGEINLRDTIPFYSRYGFMVDHEFQRTNSGSSKYISNNNVEDSICDT